MERKVIALALMVFVCCSFSAQRPKAYTFPSLSHFPVMPRGPNMVTNEGVDLGRHLFYDPILSRDSTLSCASCHKQEFAFSDAGNAFSKGNNGMRLSRNTPALFNLAWHGAFFWDGRSSGIEEQVFHPVRDKLEMDLSWNVAVNRIYNSRYYRERFRAAFGDVRIDSDLIANAIGQFERTLVSYRSRYDKVLLGKDTFTTDEKEGFILVNDMTMADCLHCHTTDADPLGSTFAFSNNGLDGVVSDKGRGSVTGNAADDGKFKIPSLRNLSFTAPYMHDGRFKTLEEVVDFYSEGVRSPQTIDPKMEFAHKGGAHLSKDEKRKIVAFLLTLNDQAFVTDPAFSDPFKKRKK